MLFKGCSIELFHAAPRLPISLHRRVHVLDYTRSQNHRRQIHAVEISGWTIIQLTTIGAKTGQQRTMPLLAGVSKAAGSPLIASSFGREHNPGWYYNLKAHPECECVLQREIADICGPGSQRGVNMRNIFKWLSSNMWAIKSTRSAPPIVISRLCYWSRKNRAGTP